VFCLLLVLDKLSVPVKVTDMERLDSKMTYNVLTGTLNPTRSLSHTYQPLTTLYFRLAGLFFQRLDCWLVGWRASSA